MEGSCYTLPVSGMTLKREAHCWSIQHESITGEVLVDPPMHLLPGGHACRLYFHSGQGIGHVFLTMADALWVSAHVGVDLVDNDSGMRYAVGTQEALFLHDG